MNRGGCGHACNGGIAEKETARGGTPVAEDSCLGAAVLHMMRMIARDCDVSVMPAVLYSGHNRTERGQIAESAAR